MMRRVLAALGLLEPVRRIRRQQRVRRQMKVVEQARAESAAPKAKLDLALVIPVHNDAENLARLLDQARDLKCFARIVVVDDGSDTPVSVPAGVDLLRHVRPLGPGAARNAGLARVQNDYVLFFDSDDRLTPELPLLLADLAEERAPFDICLFRHADSRVAQEGRYGQPDWDERFWAAAGLGCGALRDLAPKVRPVIARIANYPWNRISRTGFLRDSDVALGDTKVHEDIVPHWQGLVRADRLLASDRICAWHQISPAGERLTNLSGPERLQVFEALAQAAAAVTESTDPAWHAALADFALGLIDWVEGRLPPALWPELRQREAAWLTHWIGPLLAGIEPEFPDLSARVRAHMVPAAPSPQPAPAPETNGPPVSFVCITRGAGAAIWPLAEDIAAAARPGDQVILFDDGPAEDTRAFIGRFGAMRGWGDGVEVQHIFTGTPGAGDTGVAVTLALELAQRTLVITLPGTARLDPKGFAAARAAFGQADLLLAPVEIEDPDDPAPGQEAPPLLAGCLFRRSLLQNGPLRCDHARAAAGEMTLVAQLALQAGQIRHHSGPPLVRLPMRPQAGAGIFATARDLLQRVPLGQSHQMARWLLGVLPCWLAGTGYGLTSGLMRDLDALRQALPADLTLTDKDTPGARLLEALRAPSPAQARRGLLALTKVKPLAAPLIGGAPVALWLQGRHTNRTPFAYPPLAALWADRITLAPRPEEADLLVCANPRDLPQMPAEMVPTARRKPFALISEEPFWDSLFSPSPLSTRVTLPAGHAGQLQLHQVNHHRSPIFDFDKIPYFLLTEPAYIAAYAALFARNAARSPQDWRADALARPLRTVFMAEKRPERFHDLAFANGDILGLCAWRTRLAMTVSRGEVQRLGASWQGGTPRTQITDWHGDKIRQLDGRVQILSALENTHQPCYISEKLFDAFALGAVPLYMAGPGHRAHDLGLPATAWVNLWGMEESLAAATVDGLALAEFDWSAYALAQSTLAALFGDPAHVAAEKARLARAVLAEVERLVALGPA